MYILLFSSYLGRDTIINHHSHSTYLGITDFHEHKQIIFGRTRTLICSLDQLLDCLGSETKVWPLSPISWPIDRPLRARRLCVILLRQHWRQRETARKHLGWSFSDSMFLLFYFCFDYSAKRKRILILHQVGTSLIAFRPDLFWWNEFVYFLVDRRKSLVITFLQIGRYNVFKQRYGPRQAFVMVLIW